MKQSTATRIRVMLADDHPIVMGGFAMSLAGPDIDVVAQARSPEEALALYAAERPDVLVLDIRFGTQLTGLDVARRLLADEPQARIVFLTQFDQDSLVKECYRIGGRAFITKDCDPEELAAAVRRAYQGELYFMPAIAERLASLSVKGDESPQALLDERALAIFALMAEGLTNAEIAQRLDVSSKTISNASQAIKDRLGVHRPADITRLAVRHGLIQP
ncbi:response regulator transcription factor [Pseudoduganella chitinolytica]|uniref:Response regulator transcription factor n=1 Tax=Pseudoduganella chitinolytica TaxID=34070 RepID=A0ABY8BFE0_9BURK|nr:response regulator transcription factor [Pseudoduganella chitinolytica]WEF33442.1 response regulator transcription factor [Pseudoduganella chitinolytica]